MSLLVPVRRWLAVLVCGLAATAVAERWPSVRISRVGHQLLERGSVIRHAWPERLVSNDYETAVKEVFKVYWTAGEEGLPAGTLVLFEYRQKLSPLIRTLFIRYPFEVKGERCAEFEIGRDALRARGRVVAWRARVTHGGRVLAEQASAEW